MYVLLVVACMAFLGCAKPQTKSVIQLEQRNFFPEGIASGKNNELYVGSLSKGVIVKSNPTTGEVVPFIHGDDRLLSVTGVATDTERDVFWACSANFGMPGLDKGVSSIRAYTLSTGKLLAAFDLKEGAFPNHIAMANDGRAYVTDSFKPVIYRADLTTESCEKWLVDPQFGVLPPNPTTLVHKINLNGIAPGADGCLYAVKTNTGEMYRVTVNDDGTPGKVSIVKLPRELNRPDGLELLADGSLLIVEAGNKLSRLHPEGDTFTMELIRENMDFPTTTATLGKHVWVVESQIQHMQSPDDADPFRLIRIDLD